MQDSELGIQSWWDRRRFHVLAGVLILAVAVPTVVGLFDDSSRPIFFWVYFPLAYLFVGLVVWLTVWVWSESTDPSWRTQWAFGCAVLGFLFLSKVPFSGPCYFAIHCVFWRDRTLDRERRRPRSRRVVAWPLTWPNWVDSCRSGFAEFRFPSRTGRAKQHGCRSCT